MTEFRQRNWSDVAVEKLFAEINVMFWQIVVLGVMLWTALGIAVSMAAL